MIAGYGSIKMKISFWIHEKFKEPEIVICGAERTRELAELKQVIAEAVDEKITVYDGRDAVQIAQGEVVRFFGSRQRVYAQTADATYLVRARLYELEETLNKQFVRISNSEIVNAKKIRRMDASVSGTIHMYLQPDIETYVSRRYVSRIRDSLMR